MSINAFKASLGNPVLSLKHLSGQFGKAIETGNTNPISDCLNLTYKARRVSERKAIEEIAGKVWAGSTWNKNKNGDYVLTIKGKATNNSAMPALIKLVAKKTGLNELGKIKKELGIASDVIPTAKQLTTKSDAVAAFILANDDVSFQLFMAKVKSSLEAKLKAQSAK